MTKTTEAVMARKSEPPLQGVPKRTGWRWVPVEPTQEMEDAAMRAITACDEDFRDEDARLDFRVSYREALAAAPTPVETPAHGRHQ